MLKYDPRDIMFYHFKIPNNSLDWGLRALAGDDDVNNLGQYVKDNKVIDVFIEHGETTVESYYMPKFNQPAQIVELTENVEVVDLDEGHVDTTVVTKTHRKGKSIGLQKGRKMLAIEWLGQDGADGLGVDNEHDNDGDEELGVDNEQDNDGDEGLGVDNEHDNDVAEDGPEELVDEEHIVDELDVQMGGFRFTVDADAEDNVAEDDHVIRPTVNLKEDDLEGIDYDSLESDVGDDVVDSSRRKALRELKRKGKAGDDGLVVNHFFVGQEFCNREEAKIRIKAHAVVTRRQITIVKNENVRVRLSVMELYQI